VQECRRIGSSPRVQAGVRARTIDDLMLGRLLRLKSRGRRIDWIPDEWIRTLLDRLRYDRSRLAGRPLRRLHRFQLRILRCSGPTLCRRGWVGWLSGSAGGLASPDHPPFVQCRGGLLRSSWGFGGGCVCRPLRARPHSTEQAADFRFGAALARAIAEVAVPESGIARRTLTGVGDWEHWLSSRLGFAS
jgi:hypothetical protein